MRIPLLLFVFAPVLSQGEEMLQADLGKLNDSSTRVAEVARLAGCDGEERILTGFIWHRCPQRSGKPPLHALLPRYRFDFESRYQSPDAYPEEGLDALFGDRGNDAECPARLDPSLELIHDSALYVFDDRGREIRPYGGNNYINRGYVFDFDNDGVLDRADATSYRLDEAEDDRVEVFDLRSVEKEPRSLLRVVFNWHPRRSDSVNDWTFHCSDEDGDGYVEVAFGPKGATTDDAARRHVFRWNRKTSSYETDSLPTPAHIRILRPDESLAAVAADGGLGYPLLDHRPGAPKPEPVEALPRKSYVHRSFQEATDEQLAAFFSGRRRSLHPFESAVFAEPPPPTQLPVRFWKSEPKVAALAFAERNRTDAHRRAWRLAIDDRDGAAPPSAGWLVFDWESSGCYSLSTRHVALRFGIDQPFLAVLDYNSIGVVGRNPWADHPAHSARLIPLQQDEARFLVETIFWLDRIRSWSEEKAEPSGGYSSTADGSATLDLHPYSGDPLRLAFSTVWAGSSVAARWTDDYDRTVMVNLVAHLIQHAIPEQLGERWKIAPELQPQSLITPTEQRLRPRVDRSAGYGLEQTLGAMLAHQLPGHTLAKVANAAGNEGLVGLKPVLGEILAAMPPHEDEDREFEKLRRQFANDHFGMPLDEEGQKDKEARQRLDQLREKRRFNRAAIARDHLERCLEKLSLAGDAGALTHAVAEDAPGAGWALLRLQRIDPDAWARFVSEDFRQVGIEEQRRIIETLAAGNPKSLDTLIDDLKPEAFDALRIEIARFHHQQHPDRMKGQIAPLLDLLDDDSADLFRRTAAMELLEDAPLDPEQLGRFRQTLLEHVSRPARHEYWSSRSQAIESLAALPDSSGLAEALRALEEIDRDAFESSIAIMDGLELDSEGRDELLTHLVRLRFLPPENGMGGFMDEVFLTALAFDLGELKNEIHSFATAGPDVVEGECAFSGRSGFPGPKGERYHLARELLALWSEEHPEARGRLWAYFIHAHPGAFGEDSGNASRAKQLRDRATKALDVLSPEVRRHALDAAATWRPSGAEAWWESAAPSSSE